MKRPLLRIIAILVIFTAAGTVSACANLLEGSSETIVPHISAPFERQPDLQITVADLEEFSQLLLELIMAQEPEITIQYHNFDSEDLQAELRHVSNEILENHPIVMYSVANIAVTVTRFVTYFEVDIEIEFKRTLEQVSSVVTASSQRYMMVQLLEFMSRYEEEAVFLTSLQLEKEEIINLIVGIYYQNPRRIVMLPFVTVEVFPEEPEEGNERIYEIRFGYTENPEMLRLFSGNLDLYVRQNAEHAVGETDAEILLSLVELLIASTIFDEGTARTISMHGPQNFAATAFGALVRGSAVGEGFAMAFKALCDELRFDCRVVLGFLDDRVHAWNLIALDGHYYHIDVAMCSVDGLESAFFKTDEDFEENYTWDRENTQRANGPLTLYDIIKDDDEIIDDPDNTDQSTDNTGEED